MPSVLEMKSEAQDLDAAPQLSCHMNVGMYLSSIYILQFIHSKIEL